MKGFLPKGWKRCELGDIVEFKSGGTPNRADDSFWGGTVPWLSAKDLKSFDLRHSIERLTAAGAAQINVVPSETVLILVRGMGLFKDIPIGITSCDMAFNQDVKALIPKTSLNSRYLAHALIAMRTAIMGQVGKAGHGTGRLATESLTALPIALPTSSEQARIVAALDTWDQAIEQVSRLLLAKRRRLHDARVHLIETHQATKAPDNGWRTVGFGDLAEELRKRNVAGLTSDRVMGVLKGEGLVPMRSHVMASDLSRYLTVPANAFAYNPMRLNIGSIAKSAHPHEILVSPDYVVFQARERHADPDFLHYFIGTKRWRDHLQVVGSGSVRTRIYFDGLSELVLRAPDLAEQGRIGTILRELQHDVDLTARSLLGLRNQKRGLMQKLLTGEWRIKSQVGFDEPISADGQHISQ